MAEKRWTINELKTELERFEKELRDAGFKTSTLHNYVERSNRFLRWLAGEYTPTVNRGQ